MKNQKMQSFEEFSEEYIKSLSTHEYVKNADEALDLMLQLKNCRMVKQ
jgi:hypothetical protein